MQDLDSTFARQAGWQRTPLLQTKLYMPRQRGRYIARPRLLNMLNEAVEADGTFLRPLTLLAAPAGYGKTTLAVQWAEQLNRPVAWLSLEAGENDPTRFLAYLIAAIATVQEEAAENAFARLSSGYRYSDMESVLTTLINDIAVNDDSFLLVLDDFHEIQAPDVHEAVAYFIEHLPIQLHVLITSRSDLPFPTTQLRVRRQLHVLNHETLRFTQAEAAAFLADAMQLDLSEADVARLEGETEGWVTGLQLAALALLEGVNVNSATRGSQRYLADYLAEQVLAQQPASVQTFLEQTALLERFDSELCDSLLGWDESAETLAYLEAARLFLIPLDAQRRWYRYHHLFRDFLRARLERRLDDVAIAALHRRAATWYHAHNMPIVAIDHALNANDHALAAELLASEARQILMFGEGSTLRQWLSQLPDDLRQSDPRLCLFYAWSLVMTGAFDEAVNVATELGSNIDHSDNALFGEYAALQARLAHVTGDPERNIKFSHKALKRLPDSEHALRGDVAINLGFSHLDKDDIDAARAAFENAVRLSAHDASLWSGMFATYYLANTYVIRGQLPSAMEIYEQGLERASGTGHTGRLRPATGFMHIGIGELLHEWNDLAAAEPHLRRALRLAEQGGDHKMLIYSRSALSRLLIDQQAWEEVEAILTAQESYLKIASPSAMRSRMALARGDRQPAETWLDRVEFKLSHGVAADAEERIRTKPGAYYYVALLCHHLGREPLLPLLRLLLEYAQLSGNVPFEINVRTLTAAHYAQRADWEQAATVFAPALVLGETGRFKRIFFEDCGAHLAPLLHRMANNPVHRRYVNELLAVVTAVDPVGPTAPRQALSAREIDVLNHLATGMSNRETANAMFVSVNTVKAHTRRLYEKLGVNSRTQAVARARDLQLL